MTSKLAYPKRHAALFVPAQSIPAAKIKVPRVPAKKKPKKGK